MRVTGIIQARLGSFRLPKKMLMDLNGSTLIEWVIRRAQKSKLIDSILVVIPNTKENDKLNDYIQSLGITVFRGSEDDVLGRFYESCVNHSVDTILRICGDNPFVCPKELDRLISFYFSNDCDYAYNHIPKNNRYPDGFGAEICSFLTLEKIHINASKADHREHIFNFIWDNQRDFNIKTFDPPKSIAYPSLKFDVDTKGDLEKLRKKNYEISMHANEIVNLTIK